VAININEQAGQSGDMKRWTAQWFTILAIGTRVAADPMPVAPAQAIPAAGTAIRAAEEKEACIKNLHVMYKAIQAFQADHRDLRDLPM